MQIPLHRLTAGTAVLSILLICGCGSDSGFNEEVDFAPREGSAQFVNMMPDSPQLTIVHGLQQFQARFAVAEPIVLRPQDGYEWRLAYVDAGGQEVAVAQGEEQQITENVLSTFLFTGDLAQPQVLIMDIPILPVAERPEGMAEVWFASNITGHAMVDVYLTGFGMDLNDAMPLTTLTSGTVSERFVVTAGEAMQLRVAIAGSAQLLFDSGSIDLAQQSLDLFAFVTDFGPDAAAHADVIRSFTGGNTIEDFSQPARVRIANFSANPQVSTRLGMTDYPPVAARDRSDYLETDIDAQTLTVNAGEVETEATAIDVRPGRWQTVFIFDESDAETTATTRALIADDGSRPVTARSLLKFINGGDRTVDFFVLAGEQNTEDTAPLFNDVTFATSTTLELPSQALEFVVTSNDGAERLTSGNATLAEGESYTVVFDAGGLLHTLTD